MQVHLTLLSLLSSLSICAILLTVFDFSTYVVIFEHRIRQQIKIDDMQFRFMKGKGTTDAIFMARQMQENFRVKGKKL